MNHYLHDSKEVRRYRWHPACPDVLQRQVKVTDVHGQVAHSRLPSKLLHEGPCLLEHADKLAGNNDVHAGLINQESQSWLVMADGCYMSVVKLVLSMPCVPSCAQIDKGDAHIL